MSDYFIAVFPILIFFFGVPISMILFNFADFLFYKVQRIKKEFFKDYPPVSFKDRFGRLFHRSNNK